MTSPLLAPDDLRWLYIDFDSYFASVEQQEDPALRGRPVAVVPVMTRGTCAIAASYEAKAHGIRTGTPVHEALRLCPGLVLRLARHKVYVDYHRRLLDEINRHIPVVRVCSIDEAACALMGRERHRVHALAIAAAIKEGVARHVGDHVRCSIGVAPNRFLAKVASEMEKPNGLVVMEPGELPGRLLSLALRDLPGIGANMERRLVAAGVPDVATFWNLQPGQARRIWGSVQGERFWYMLHGADISDDERQVRRTLGHSHVLGPRVRAPEEARLVARRLTVKAAARLRRLELVTGTVALSVRLEDGGRWQGIRRLEPTRDSFAILATLMVLWRDMQRVYGPAPVRKIAVTFLDLVPESALMPDLFTHATTATPAFRRRELLAAVDAINARHGRDSVMVGALPAEGRDEVGARIAFTRIPEVHEFDE